MKSFVRKRISLFAKLMVAAGILISVVGALWPFKAFPIFIIFFGIAVCFFPKGRWYLILPYSRKYLLLMHLVESFFFTIVTIVVAGAVYLFFADRHPEMITNFSVELVLIMPIFFGFLRTLIPINTNIYQTNLENREVNRLKIKESPRRFVIPIGIYLAIFIIWREVDHIDPVFWCIGMIFLVSMSPMLALSLIVMPLDTLRKWRISCIGIGLALSMGLVVGSIYIVFAGSTKGLPIRAATYILGRMPIPLSQQRKLDLAMVPNGAEKMPLLEVDENSKLTVSEAQWKERTEQCSSNACLDISDMLIPSSFTEEKKIDRFIAIMQRCNPGMKKGGYLRCTGPRLSGDRLEPWLHKLVETKVIDKWLEGSDPLLQFIAIRTLASFDLNEVKTKRIKELMLSDDNAVKTAAHFYFAFYAKESCGQENNKCQKPLTLSELF